MKYLKNKLNKKYKTKVNPQYKNAKKIDSSWDMYSKTLSEINKKPVFSYKKIENILNLNDGIHFYSYVAIRFFNYQYWLSFILCWSNK